MVQSRIAPAPISRGMSVRKLPRASYDEIEGVCNHYLAKVCTARARIATRVAAAHASPTPHAQTGGAYDGPASRAVFDLAHEVKALLAPAQEEEGRRRARVRHLENLMLEWEEVFGQGSSALTPAVVVEQLRAQGAEIAQLRARLAATEEYAVAAEAEWERVLAGHHHQHRLELERAHAQFGAVSYTGGGGEAAPPSPGAGLRNDLRAETRDRLERLRGMPAL